MHSARLILALLLSAHLPSPAAPYTLTPASHTPFQRPDTPTGLSGITYHSHDLYYTVDDNHGLMWPVNIGILRATGVITSCVFQAGVSLEGGKDLEGIAYNHATETLFVSDEVGATIQEYSASGGAPLNSVAVPTNLRAYRHNFSLESLTIRTGGLEMWTANEEALYHAKSGIDDGPLSSQSYGTLVRLTRFSRPTPHAPWRPSGQWAYQCDPYPYKPFSGAERSGVADLCILPDGTLLVLERAFSMNWIALIPVPDFRTRIYAVDFTHATEITPITSLNGATYTKTAKTLQWERSFIDTNLEGICLGPRLDDGSFVLLMVSDGDSETAKVLLSLKLKGLKPKP